MFKKLKTHRDNQVQKLVEGFRKKVHIEPKDHNLLVILESCFYFQEKFLHLSAFYLYKQKQLDYYHDYWIPEIWKSLQIFSDL